MTVALGLRDDGSGAAVGLPAIAAIMAAAPVPILVLGTHPPGDPRVAAALAAGAVEHLAVDPADPAASATALRRTVLVLSRVQLVTRSAKRPDASRPAEGAVIALVASTGGPTALRTVLGALGDAGAPILVVQHIHVDFAETFAGWLAEEIALPVALAVDGEPALAGQVHVAPPGRHLRLAPGRRLTLSASPERLLRPSGDELLRSVAEHARHLGVGAVLTGMGDDGARGLLELRERGGATFAEDGASAAVDGMPRAARELGAVTSSLPLAALGPALAEAARRVARR